MRRSEWPLPPVVWNDGKHHGRHYDMVEVRVATPHDGRFFDADTVIVIGRLLLETVSHRHLAIGVWEWLT